MKVVCCKNCGAKYQLDDTDDITTFECSSCAGDLEYIDEESDEENNPNPPYINSYNHDDSYIVQCKDCGLKYKIKSSDSILDYECDSCGGSLRYLDEEMNKELAKYVKERKEEIKQIKKDAKSENNEESEISKEPKSIKSLTNKLEHFFSEERMMEIADDEKRERELAEGNHLKTARTTIPYAVESKFGREFAVPKTNDYDVLKNFLKDEFYKGMEDYYPKADDLKENQGGFFDKLIIKEPENEDASTEALYSQQADSILDVENVNSNQYALAIGGTIFILSIIEILFINSGYGIITLIIGVILLCYGLYKNQGEDESEQRTRIIREHLLTLPEEYYVFYNVKTPTSSSGINHLVVGPTGIYALLSHKYNPKLKLESENETLNFKNELNDDKFEEFSTSGRRRFRYTTKQAKFSQDNKIKQKALSLGEDLINFLNDNNIRNCFVEPLVGFINNDVVIINTPLTDEDLFIDELLYQIQNGTIKLDHETIDKCAVLINKYSADCSAEI